MTDVRKSAKDLLEKHHVVRPPVRAEKIAESEGVRVVFAEFEETVTNEIHGYYDHELGLIVVNSADSAEEKQFTIAHELGHHLMHQDYSASEKYVPRLKEEVETKHEREADEFALRMLVPESFGPVYADLFTDEEMQQVFVVTPDALKAAKKLF